MCQLLTEALLLAAGGALAGFVIASVTLSFLVSQMGDGDTPVQFLTTPLEWPVLLYGVGLALLTGLVCGLYPAWDAARTSAAATLKNAAGRHRPDAACRVRGEASFAAGHNLRRAADTYRPVSEESGELDGVDLGSKTDRVVDIHHFARDERPLVRGLPGIAGTRGIRTCCDSRRHRRDRRDLPG